MDQLSDNVTIERYKYLLAQRQHLNDATFKIASVFQVIFLTLCSAQYALILEVLDKKIKAEFALDASTFLLWVTLLVSAMTVILLIGGMASWLNNRNEESGILEQIGQEGRPAIVLKSVFAWYEIYIIATIVILGAAYTIAYYWIVVPAVSAAVNAGRLAG